MPIRLKRSVNDLFFQGKSLDLLTESGSSASSFYLFLLLCKFRRNNCLLWSLRVMYMWQHLYHVWKENESENITQLCPTLCDPMDCSPPNSSAHGILQARILEWVDVPSSQGIFLTQGLSMGVACVGLIFLVWRLFSVSMSPAFFLGVCWPCCPCCRCADEVAGCPLPEFSAVVAAVCIPGAHSGSGSWLLLESMAVAGTCYQS